MHWAAENGSSKACEVILNLRLDAVYDTDKKVFYIIATVTGTISKNSCSPPSYLYKHYRCHFPKCKPSQLATF